MGILNVTPDSFYDGGKYSALDAAMARAAQIIDEGADIIDIGGESTRPQATAVSINAELDRVIPIIERVAQITDITISIDTRHAEVMGAAIAAGANFINDISGMQTTANLKVAAQHNVPVCIMHMQGSPATMQLSPNYKNADVVTAVLDFLSQQIARCKQYKIDPKNIIVDPGFGFGKTPQHNQALLQNLAKLQILQCPILVGVSRKSMLGHIIGDIHADRLVASVAASMQAYRHGASIFRVHDVAATVQAMQFV